MKRFISSHTKAKVKAAILDGSGISKAWQEELGREAAILRQRLGRPPGLAVVIVGDRPDSKIYVQRKLEACSRVGIASEVKQLAEHATQTQLEGVVRHLCKQPGVDGILVQLPLPAHLNEEAVMDVLDPAVDVDGFHPISVGRLVMRNRARSLIPCTALGCMELLKRSNIDLRGKEAVLLGDSNVVGTPLAMLLRDSGIAATTLCSRPAFSSIFENSQNAAERAAAQACLPALPGPLPANEYEVPDDMPNEHCEVGPSGQISGQEAGEQRSAKPVSRSNTAKQQGNTHASRSIEAFDLPAITHRADLLVVAVGNPEMVKVDWIKPGAVVLDVGINVVSRNGRQRTVGDVAFEEVAAVASAITPVPGGVGPMTIAALLHNTLQAARAKAGEEHQKNYQHAGTG